MKAYIDGYKKKVVTLLKLCLEAKENGIDISFDFSATTDAVEIRHHHQLGYVKVFNVFLDWLEHSLNLDEAIEYVQNLIEGDSNDTR